MDRVQSMAFSFSMQLTTFFGIVKQTFTTAGTGRHLVAKTVANTVLNMHSNLGAVSKNPLWPRPHFGVNPGLTDPLRFQKYAPDFIGDLTGHEGLSTFACGHCAKSHCTTCARSFPHRHQHEQNLVRARNQQILQ